MKSGERSVLSLCGLPLRIAIQFLTRLPVSVPRSVQEQHLGQSVLAYPLVGLAIGAFLTLVAALLAGVDKSVAAALILSVWVVTTGGLHLDGLADCADAWVGGIGSTSRALEIMKDPVSGPAGVSVLILQLLLKYSALLVILESQAYVWLLMAPVVGRTVVIPAILFIPYVRAGGLGEILARSMPRRIGFCVLVGVCLAGSVFLGNTSLIAAVFVFLCLRILCIERLGGATGDVYGAMIECVETAVLVSFAFAD